MDEVLKAQLKKRGLLPLELDHEAQEQYILQGIDPSKTESHYSPGTPQQVVELYDRISETALRLHRMELIAQSGTTYYKMLEDGIKTDLSSVEHILMKGKNPPATGTGGFNRDV